MKKRIFCLLLVVAIVSSLGMTAFAEPDAIVEPAPQEPAAETTTTEPEQPAPAPGTETPVEPAPEAPAEPAPQVPAEPEAPAEPAEPAAVPAEPEAPAEPAEVPVETAPVPEGEPAGDVPAAGEEVPGVEDAPVQDTAPAPNDGIATIGEPAPASNDGIATIGDPEPAPLSLTLSADKEEISTQDAYNCWKAYAGGNTNWKSDDELKKGYITLTLTGAEDRVNEIQWSVKPDKGGVGAGYDGSPGTTCVGIADGNVLYLMGGTDLVGCPSGFICTITVSATVDGTQSNTVTITFKGPDPKPVETPEPAKGVLLHVENGNFTGEYTVDGEKKDISNEASVWVEFKKDEAGAYTRSLPDTLPTVMATNGQFKGWYTEPPIEEMVTSADGTYCYRKTTKVNGVEVKAGGEVPAGVQVLYAVFEYTDPQGSAETQLIEYYYDYNGMYGMYGHCLTRTGLKQNAKFTAEDAAVYGFNCDKDAFSTEAPTWEKLKDYWAKTSFDGYTFKGWSKDPHGDVITEDTEVTNGMTFYAQWTAEDGSSSEDFEPPKPGPLTNIRVTSSLNESCHATEGNTMTVTVAGFPIGAKLNDLTYTVTYTPSTDNLKDLISGSKTVTADVTVEKPLTCDYFKAEIKGTSLVVTKVGTQGVSLKVHVTAKDEDGNLAQTDGGDPVLTFEHQISGTWQQTKAPTCTTAGEEKAHCDGCGQEVTRKVYPLEHLWKFQITKEPTCTEEGIKQEQCLRCETTFDQYQKWMAEKYGPKNVPEPKNQPEVIPATGHTCEKVSYAGSKAGASIYTTKCATCNEDLGTVINGDVSGDSKVSMIDVFMTCQYVARDVSELPEEVAADVTGDGKVSMADVYTICQFVAREKPTL